MTSSSTFSLQGSFLDALQSSADGAMSAADLADLLADRAGLADEDRSARYANGMNRWSQNVRVCFQTLRKKGLVRSPRRGVYALTERGRAYEVGEDDTVITNPSMGAQEPQPTVAAIAGAPTLSELSDNEPGHGAADAEEQGPEAETPETPSSPEDADVVHAMQALGFVLEYEGGALRASLSAGCAVLDADLCILGQDGHVASARAGRDRLLVRLCALIPVAVASPGDHVINASTVLGLASRHKTSPVTAHEILTGFSEAGLDADTALSSLVERGSLRDRALRAVDAIHAFLVHNSVRPGFGPIAADQIYWYASGAGIAGGLDVASIRHGLETLSCPGIGLLRNENGAFWVQVSPASRGKARYLNAVAI